MSLAATGSVTALAIAVASLPRPRRARSIAFVTAARFSEDGASPGARTTGICCWGLTDAKAGAKAGAKAWGFVSAESTPEGGAPIGLGNATTATGIPSAGRIFGSGTAPLCAAFAASFLVAAFLEASLAEEGLAGD